MPSPLYDPFYHLYQENERINPLRDGRWSDAFRSSHPRPERQAYSRWIGFERNSRSVLGIGPLARPPLPDFINGPHVIRAILGSNPEVSRFKRWIDDVLNQVVDVPAWAMRRQAREQGGLGRGERIESIVGVVVEMCQDLYDWMLLLHGDPSISYDILQTALGFTRSVLAYARLSLGALRRHTQPGGRLSYLRPGPRGSENFASLVQYSARVSWMLHQIDHLQSHIGAGLMGTANLSLRPRRI